MIRTGDRQLIKELNIALVMNVIRQHEPISRVDIADRTGLGRSTVTGIINTLLKEGLVAESGSAESSSGRKPVLLTFNARTLYVIGIKLAPRSAHVALVDLNAEVLYTEQVPLGLGGGFGAIIAALKAGVDNVIAATGTAREKVLGVGLVMPGVVDPGSGTAVSSYFLGWANVPVRDILEQELDLPVYVDNDANGMALAEALYGAGRGMSDILAVTVGVGVGGGLIIGGRIHRGAGNSAGELGHTCVVRDGPTCVCGRKGCLEALAGDAAIVRRAREEVLAGRAELLRFLCHGQVDLITRELVVEAAADGDVGARAALVEAGAWLGLALGNAVNLISPSRIVVGGEAVLQAGELILAPMRQAMAAVVFPTLTEQPQVVRAMLGEHAWVQGAAALVLSDAFQVPLHAQTTMGMARRVGQSNS
ncbi:MAG TPA: ROK family transcriptional regulator [Symbiobacteriaceae bacterium]|jgi:glucokinase-like ROK family protein|nr:ROK family transcriptional regulator [Symbiobacteriaceae bacterium]